jgi:hypothetical protein
MMNCPSLGWCATWLSLLGMLIAPPLAADEPPAAATLNGIPIVDVALDARQCLRGQVVAADGVPLSDATLTLRRNGELVQESAADDLGQFQIQVPRGGVYELVAQGESTYLRVWTAKAAPPGCAQQLIVVRGDVLRGQSGRIPYTQVNPWLVAGVVAVAVAIPVVLANNRKDRGDGS